MPRQKNYAYIDAANLHKANQDLGWKLDYQRFRVWLTDKYQVRRAYIFIGLISKYRDLYTYLQESGFTLVFKEVVYDGRGKPKGNCDADLVLQATKDFYEKVCDEAVIVASDGDYASLVKFFQDAGHLRVLLSPGTEKKCSILLKRTGAKIAYLNDQKSLLTSQNEKAPDVDEPHKGLFRSD